MNYFRAFCGKEIVLEYLRYLHMIEDFRMNIEDLMSASLRAVGSALYEPEAGGSIIKNHQQQLRGKSRGIITASYGELNPDKD